MAVQIWTGTTSGAWATITNWLSGSAPSNGDSVIIPADATVDIDGSAPATTLVGFTVEPGCSINIGSAATPLTLILLHSGAYYNAKLAGTGTSYLGFVNYNRITVSAAPSSPGIGQYGLNLSGTLDGTAPGIVSITAGSNQSIGIGAKAGDDMQVDSLEVYGAASVDVGTLVTKNDDATAIPLSMSAGTVTTNCALGAVAQYGGTLTHESGAMASLTVGNGTCYYKSTGTLAAATVQYKGVLDFSKDLSARTVSACDVYYGGIVKDPGKTVTWTAGIDLNQCKLADVSGMDVGANFRLTRGSVA